ncbi:MAG: ketopantoate reductase family protein [candidate division NC10 bacterium]|nr:ketopantoate reductase family protein [candidate division NC10 bacterium]
MRTVIVGAGGLGSVVGGYLAKAGYPVTLIARPAHVKAIRDSGLEIAAVDGRHLIREVQATDNPKTVTAADLLILTVKTYDTDEALKGVAHLSGRVRCALSLQNGVLKDRALGAVFGPESVIGAATMIGATLTGPGKVHYTAPSTTYVGEFDRRETDRVGAVAEMFDKAGLRIQAAADIRSVTWCKLNHILPSAGLSVLTRLEFHRVLKNRTLAALFVELTRECAQLAKAQGIPLDDFPGFEVKTVCEEPLEQAIAFVREYAQKIEAAGMTHVKISMLQDIERGKRTEVEEIIGYVVREAARLEIQVPKIDLIYRLVKGVSEAVRH